MSSGKHRQSSVVEHQFDTSDIKLARPIPIKLASATPEHEGFASGSVVAVVTEDAERIHIHESRDTLEQPPLRRGADGIPPTPTSDDPTAPTKMSRDVIAAKRGIPPLRP